MRERSEALVLGSGPLLVAVDPLDGSRNIESSTPTGMIFGIFETGALVASGYALFSSTTIFVLAIRGAGVHSWSLGSKWQRTGCGLRMPQRGQIYSLNDARYFDWPVGLRTYIDNIRKGIGLSGKKYSARYVCCLVADFHRTLLSGGWCGNPRPHLRVLFECLPLALVAEESGGVASDGRSRYVTKTHSLMSVHEKAPLFVGSRLDIEELESYRDVQQLDGQSYTV